MIEPANDSDDNEDYEYQPEDRDYDTVAQRRREKVRIPNAYLEKTREERLKDQNDLFSRFQILLTLPPQSNVTN